MSRRNVYNRGDINKVEIMRQLKEQEMRDLQRIEKEAAMQREQEAAMQRRKQEAMQRKQREQEAAIARRRMQREQEEMQFEAIKKAFQESVTVNTGESDESQRARDFSNSRVLNRLKVFTTDVPAPVMPDLAPRVRKPLRIFTEDSENARDVQQFVHPMSLQDSANSFSQKRQQDILRNQHLQGLQGLASRTRPVFPLNSALSSEPFELLSDPRSEKDIAEAREREGYQRYLNTYFSEIKPGYPGALFSRTATNIPDKKGGGARKKKSRQKKQHHRRNRRHSTRKYKK